MNRYQFSRIKIYLRRSSIAGEVGIPFEPSFVSVLGLLAVSRLGVFEPTPFYVDVITHHTILSLVLLTPHFRVRYGHGTLAWFCKSSRNCAPPPNNSF